MQAVFYEQYGDVSALQFGDRPRPSIGANDVLVEMRAAGLNPVDFKIRAGYIQNWPQQFPIITGWDVAGVVVEVGIDCKKFKIGDEVYSYNRPAFDDANFGPSEEKIGANGCCAQYVKVAEWKLAHKPKTITFSEAGGIPLAALTAFQVLLLRLECYKLLYVIGII
jgi:NADPH:quinone reductase-like Zn-dependent oxidoreductase